MSSFSRVKESAYEQTETIPPGRRQLDLFLHKPAWRVNCMCRGSWALYCAWHRGLYGILAV